MDPLEKRYDDQLEPQVQPSTDGGDLNGGNPAQGTGLWHDHALADDFSRSLERVQQQEAWLQSQAQPQWLEGQAPSTELGSSTPQSTNTAQAGTTLLVVDTGLPNWQQQLSGLGQQHDLLLVGPDQAGIQLLHDAMAGRSYERVQLLLDSSPSGDGANWQLGRDALSGDLQQALALEPSVAVDLVQPAAIATTALDSADALLGLARQSLQIAHDQGRLESAVAGAFSEANQAAVMAAALAFLQGSQNPTLQWVRFERSNIRGAYLSGSNTILLSEQLQDAPEPILRAVLLEEVGHWLEQGAAQLADSPGDEGEGFADRLLGVDPERLTHAQTNQDHVWLEIDGSRVEAELASVTSAGTNLNGTKITIQFDEAMQFAGTSDPNNFLLTRFKLIRNGVQTDGAIAFSSYQFSSPISQALNLYLNSAFTISPGDSISLAYTDYSSVNDSFGVLENSRYDDLASGVTIVSNMTTSSGSGGMNTYVPPSSGGGSGTPYVVSSSAAYESAYQRLNIPFSEPLSVTGANTSIAPSLFTLTLASGGATGVAVSSVSIDMSNVRLGLSTPLPSGTYRINYTPPTLQSDGRLEDVDGNDVGSFSLDVFNTGSGSTTPASAPQLLSIQGTTFDANTNSITLTFDQDLNQTGITLSTLLARFSLSIGDLTSNPTQISNGFSGVSFSGTKAIKLALNSSALSGYLASSPTLNITYTDPNLNSDDSGKVIEGSLGLDTATFTTSIRPSGGSNNPPTLSSVATITGASEDLFKEITYADLASGANEVDADGDPLSFRIDAVFNGTLEKWSGSAWVAVTPGSTLLAPNEKLQWKADLNANGTLNAFTVSAYDGSVASATPVQVQVRVAPVNDAPLAGGSATLPALLEDISSPAFNTVSNLFSANFSDVTDNSGNFTANTLAGVAVIANTATAAQGKWQWQASGSSTWNDIGTSGLSDSAALFLESTTKLRFLPTTNFNSTPGPLITRLVESPATGFSNGTTTNASPNGGNTVISTNTVPLFSPIIAVNDIPLLTSSAPAAISVVEDSNNTNAISLGLSSLAYGAGGGSDESNQSFTYTLTGIPPFIHVFQSDGTTAVNTGSTLTLAQLQGLKYKTVANANGTSNLTWTVQDSGGTANGGVDTLNQSLAITVTAVNDSPVQTGTPPTPITVLEDSNNASATTLGLSGLAYASGGGTDEGNQNLTYTLTGIPGLINVFQADGTTAVTAGSTLTLSQLQGLTYKTIANVNGTGNLTWTVRDSGGSNDGGVDTLSQSLAISVIAVNDPPQRTSNPAPSISILEDSSNTTAVSLGLNSLTYTSGPAADESGQSLGAILTSIPPFITVFKADGVTSVGVNTNLTLAELQGLKYKTIANANGSGTLSWRVQDSGGTTNSGSDSFTDSLTINIVAVNDAPNRTGQTPTLPSGQESTPYLIRAQDLLVGFGDADLGDQLSITNLTATNGNLVDNNNGTWTFTPVNSNVISLGQILEDTPRTLSVDDLLGGSRTAIQVSLYYDVRDSAGATIAGNTSFELARTSSVNAVSVSNLNMLSGSGSLVTNSNNTWTFTPATNWFGTVEFSYDISTGGATLPYSASLSVQPVNDAPIASPSSAFGIEDSLSTGFMTAMDPENNPMSVIRVRDTANAATWTVVSQVPNDNGSVLSNGYGTLRVRPYGSFNFLADGPLSQALAVGQTAQTSFNYEVSDGALVSTSTVTFNITGSNDIPTVVADTASTNEDAVLIVNAAQGVLANDSDVDAGAQLSVVKIGAPGQASVEIGNTGFATLANAYGTLAMRADGSYSFTANGDASQRLAAGERVTLSFAYQVWDGLGGWLDNGNTIPLNDPLRATNTLSITVTGTNDAPLIGSLINLGSTPEERSTTITSQQLLVNTSDVDSGSILSITDLRVDPNQGSISLKPQASDWQASLNEAIQPRAINPNWGNDYSNYPLSISSDAAGNIYLLSAVFAPSSGGTPSQGNFEGNILTVFSPIGRILRATQVCDATDGLSSEGDQQRWGIATSPDGKTLINTGKKLFIIQQNSSEIVVNTPYVFNERGSTLRSAIFEDGFFYAQNQSHLLRIDPSNGTILNSIQTTYADPWRSSGAGIVLAAKGNTLIASDSTEIWGYTFNQNGTTTALQRSSFPTHSLGLMDMVAIATDKIIACGEGPTAGDGFITQYTYTPQAGWRQDWYTVSSEAYILTRLEIATHSSTDYILATGRSGSGGIEVKLDLQGNKLSTTLDNNSTTKSSFLSHTTANGFVSLRHSTYNGVTLIEHTKSTRISNPTLDPEWIFTPTADFNGEASFSYTINDGYTSTQAALSARLTITPINDAPRLIGTPQPLPDGIDGQAYTFTTAQLLQGYTDIDPGDLLNVQNLRSNAGTIDNLGNGNWRFTRNAQNRIDLGTMLEDGSRTLSFNQLLGGSLSAIGITLNYEVIDGAGGQTSAQQQFNLQRGSALSNATVDNLALIPPSAGTITGNQATGWTVTPNPNVNGLIQLSYDLVTSNGRSSYLADLQVSPVNDAPMVVVPTGLNAVEDTPLPLTGFGLADIDGDELTLTLQVGRGALLLDNAPGLAARSGNGSTATPLQLRGPVAALNAALALIRYQPDANATGSDQLSISAIDASTSGIGGPALISRSVPISITAVNDPPVRLSGTVAALVLNEDAPASSLGLQQLSYGPGGGDDEASQTLTYTITTVPSALFGGLQLADGTPVSATQVLSLAQLQGLQFQANPNASGLGSFSFSVNDGVGGTLTETVAIQVREQNDPPVRLGTAPAALVVSEASGISALGLDTVRYAPAALLTQPGTALAAMELSNGNKILGLINPAANQFTALTSATYQGMLGDEVVAQRPGSTELFIRQGNAILRIDLSTGQQTTLLSSAPMLLGYRPIGDALVVYDPTTAQIQAVNLTTATSTTLATGVLPGAAIQAGGFASFNATTDQVTLLSSTNPGVVLTSVTLSTGVQTSTTANLPDLQALAGSSTQPNTVFGIWEDAAQRGVLVIGRIDVQTGAAQTLARLSTGTSSGGFSNYNFDVNADGIAFVHYSGLFNGLQGNWIASLDTNTGTVLGAKENPGDLIRGSAPISNEATQQLSVRITALPDASLGAVVLADGSTAVQLANTYTVAELQGMQFRSSRDGNGSGSFSYVVEDNGTTNGAAAPLGLAETLSIRVLPVNDAPLSAGRAVGPVFIVDNNNLKLNAGTGLYQPIPLGLADVVTVPPTAAVAYAAGAATDEAAQALSYTITELPRAIDTLLSATTMATAPSANARLSTVYAAGDVVTATVNGTGIRYTVRATDISVTSAVTTRANIATALVAAVNANAATNGLLRAEVNNDDPERLTFTATAAGVSLQLTSDTSLGAVLLRNGNNQLSAVTAGQVLTLEQLKALEFRPSEGITELSAAARLGQFAFSVNDNGTAASGGNASLQQCLTILVDTNKATARTGARITGITSDEQAIAAAMSLDPTNPTPGVTDTRVKGLSTSLYSQLETSNPLYLAEIGGQGAIDGDPINYTPAAVPFLFDLPVPNSTPGAQLTHRLTYKSTLSGQFRSNAEGNSYSLVAPVAGFSLSSAGSWSFDPLHAAYQALALNQTQTVSVAYREQANGPSRVLTIDLTRIDLGDGDSTIMATPSGSEAKRTSFRRGEWIASSTEGREKDRYFKFISEATLLSYGAVDTGQLNDDGEKVFAWTGTLLTADGQPLTLLDGSTITSPGYYDFTRRESTGDGVEFIYQTVLEKDKPVDYIVGMKFFLTNNMYGDNDPARNNIRDPGAPITVMEELGEITTSYGFASYETVTTSDSNNTQLRVSQANTLLTANPYPFDGGRGLVLQSTVQGSGLNAMQLAQATAIANTGASGGAAAGQSALSLQGGEDGKEADSGDQDSQGTTKVAQGAGANAKPKPGDPGDQRGPSERGLKLDPIQELASAATAEPSGLLEQLSDTNILGTNLLDALALGAGVLYLLYGPKAITASKGGFSTWLAGGFGRRSAAAAATATGGERSVLALFLMRQPNGQQQLVAARVGQSSLKLLAQQELAPQQAGAQLSEALATVLEQLPRERCELLLLDPRLQRAAAATTAQLDQLGERRQELASAALASPLAACSDNELAQLRAWLNKPSGSLPQDLPLFQLLQQRQQSYAANLPEQQATMASLIELSLALAWSERP